MINSRVLIQDKLHNPYNLLYGVVVRITNEYADLLLDNGQWLLREIKLLVSTTNEVINDSGET